jgi:hypothetical protein
MLLTWTAPGDDGTTGTVTSYDIRYSTSQITEANFTAANEFGRGDTPLKTGGLQESIIIYGLTPNTTYYFAIKTKDEAGNKSLLSNTPSQSTTATVAAEDDHTPPAAITTLVATAGPTPSSSITLTWTAPGEIENTTGTTAGEYDIRYFDSPITEANFKDCYSVQDAPQPLVAGTIQTMTMTGLPPNKTVYFAMITLNEAGKSILSNITQLTTAPTP